MKTFLSFLNEKYLTLDDARAAYRQGIKDGTIGKCPSCGSPNLEKTTNIGERLCVDCDNISDNWRIKE